MSDGGGAFCHSYHRPHQRKGNKCVGEKRHRTPAVRRKRGSDAEPRLYSSPGLPSSPGRGGEGSPHPAQPPCAAYLCVIPGCFTLASPVLGRLCTDSCPRLRATMATARKRPRVPRLGLLDAGRPSRSSGPRALRPCSEHTKDTCMPPALSSGLRLASFRAPGSLKALRRRDKTFSQKVKQRQAVLQG